MKTLIPINRVEGSFLGLALGDAFGRPLEFVSGAPVQTNKVLIDAHSFMWTDETHMSLYIADAVLQMPQSKFTENAFGHLIGSYLSLWLEDPLTPSTNPGNTTIAGVENYKTIKDWKNSGVKTSDGSGAVVRICPLAISYEGDILDKAAEIACKITHAHPNAIASTVAASRLLRHALVHGQLSEQTIQQTAEQIKLVYPEAPDVYSALISAITESKRTDLQWLDGAEIPPGDGGWRSPSTLGLALVSVLKWGDDFATAVEKSARISGDSDAVACMTGMFLGAIKGVSGLPVAWLSALPQEKDLRQKAIALQTQQNSETISVTSMIKNSMGVGAEIFVANVQTGTYQIRVGQQNKEGVQILQQLSMELGVELQQHENALSIEIDRSLVPADVRKQALHTKIPQPSLLASQPQSKTQVDAPPKSTKPKNNIRTSITDPIGVDYVSSNIYTKRGRLGMTFAPGKKAPSLYGSSWDRDLQADLDRMKAIHHVDVLVSLIEDFELIELHIENLVEEANNRDIAVYRSAIVDCSIPTMEQAHAIGKLAVTLTQAGQNVVFHCRGGLGRAGTLCAIALVESGFSSKEAISVVRATRSGTIQTSGQEKFIHTYAEQKSAGKK